MDNIESLHNRIKLYSELREKHMQTHERWFQSLLVAASGLLGALVALTNNSQERIEIRILFVSPIATGYPSRSNRTILQYGVCKSCEEGSSLVYIK